MLSGAALRKTSTRYEFSSEYALEEFVWNNLEQLFQLKPIARQHPAKGEFCDILGVSNKQLSILELKNTEDRYVVQQLTRYYDNLFDLKPFTEQIDYSLPVKLVALAPVFHRHNYIDRKYCKLDIDFLQVTVTQRLEDFYLQLIDVDTNVLNEIKIPYQKLDISTTISDVPAPPQLLLDWLGAVSGDEQIAILKMRERILGFDARITEEIEGKNIIRYKGKNKPVAEIYYYRTKSQPIIFLWLPTPSSCDSDKKLMGRIRLWLQGDKVTDVGHITEGMGKMRLESEWQSMAPNKRPGNYYHRKYSPYHAGIYNKLWQEDNWDAVVLELLVNLALEKWLIRI